MSKLFDIFSISAITAAIGYIFGTLQSVLLENLRRHQNKKLEAFKVEQSIKIERDKILSSLRDHALLYYYRPLQVTLDAFTRRFQLVVNDLGENYGYERQDIIAHFSYEFACLCFWLERPAYDPDLVDQALSATHTQALRDALTLITKIPTYEQKKVAERMGCSERSMPLPLDSFSKMATAILDVKTINDVSSLEIFNPLIKNLLDEIHSGEIKADVSLKNALSTLNWMA